VEGSDHFTRTCESRFLFCKINRLRSTKVVNHLGGVMVYLDL